MTNKTLLILITLILLILTPHLSAQETSEDLTVFVKSPDPEISFPDQQPTIVIGYNSTSQIITDKITLIVDGYDVTNWEEETFISQTETIYETSDIFKWADGNHTVEITVVNNDGKKVTQSWNFTVDTSIVIQESQPFDIMGLLRNVMIGTIFVLAALLIVILYLKLTKGFTFEKFFAQHPIQKEIFTLYIPIILAFFTFLIGFAYISSLAEPIQYGLEYILVISFFVGLAPYGFDALLERRKIKKYERAYAQMLFEIADAMRGGLDPTKAIIELSKTDTSIIQKNLRVAADNIKLGRPFDEVMKTMAKPIKSDLVQQYAELIADTSKIGGEPAQVIHRAAKDMDDFIKIVDERRRQLMGQATVIYVSFGVLLMVLYQLISIYPMIESMDISLLSGGLEAGEGGSTVQRMNFFTLKTRFLDLLIINSLGTGTVIGSFVDGHIRHGILHSLMLTAVSLIFFVVMIQ